MLGPFRRSSSSDDEPSNRPNPNRAHRPVKRALFGPTDHDENLKFVRSELKKHQEESARKYNFNFEEERPLKGRFEWEPVPQHDIHPVSNPPPPPIFFILVHETSL